MTTVIHYDLYCITEAQRVQTWGTVRPTVCPNNNTHTIDSSSITSLEQISQTDTIVSAPKEGTKGFYRVQGFPMTITAGTGIVSTMDVSFPYITSVRSTDLIVTTDNLGDHIEVISAPDTVVGSITAAVSIGNTIINVSPSALQNINSGFLISLSDGVNTSKLGECISVNNVAGTITVEIPANQNYSAVTPTYVRLTVSRIKNMNLVSAGIISLGASELGGSSNPANNVNRVIYTNNSSIAKTFNICAELFY